MGDILEGLGKLLVEFSLRRLVGLVALVVVLSLGLVVYERLTSSFQLARIERITSIIDRLAPIDTGHAATDSTVWQIRALMRRQLDEAARKAPLKIRIPQQLLPTFDVGVIRFLSGAGIWLLLMLAAAGSFDPSKEKDEQARAKADKDQTEAVSQAAVIAVASGIISVFLPLRTDWWFLVFAYPITVMVVGLGLLAVPELLRAKRSPPVASDSGVLAKTL